MMGKLIIARHGESEWNARGVWTGNTDVHLTKKGFHEAELLGEKIKDIKVDVAFCSEQIRSYETLEHMLNSSGQPDVDIERSDAINERDYGDYTGKNKWQVKEEVGEERFQAIRRGWDEPVQGGETLKMVYERSVPFYTSKILPLLTAGKNALVVAHGNSIRSLMKYIESISDEEIEKTEMIFGEILIYEVDGRGIMITKEVRKIEVTLPPA